MLLIAVLFYEAPLTIKKQENISILCYTMYARINYVDINLALVQIFSYRFYRQLKKIIIFTCCRKLSVYLSVYQYIYF